MTYGNIVKVPAPIDAYKASHEEVEKALDGKHPDGLIFHAARATGTGFEIYEVWESKAHADKFNAEVVWPAVARTGVAPPDAQPEVTEFEPVGIMTAGS